MDPTDAEAREELFWSLLHLGRADDARIEGERLIQEHSPTLPVLLEVAKLLIQADKPSDAVQLLRDRWRQDSAAGAVLAWAYDAAGKDGLAEFVRAEVRGTRHGSVAAVGRTYFANQLVRLLREEGEGGDAPREASALLKALARGRFAQAGPLFLEWLEAASDPSLTVLAQADWAMLIGSPEEARSVLLRYPVDIRFASKVENRLGDIARLSGDLSQARRHWKRAVVLNPEDWNAWTDLIRDRVVSGDLPAAERLKERVLRLGPPEDVRKTLRAATTLVLDDRARSPGIYALAWTPSGGRVISVGCELDSRLDGLLITGQAGRGLEESVRTAYQYLRRNEGCFEEGGVHVHLPEMDTMVEGGSAGLAFLALLWLSATGRTVDRRIALTGQIGLEGRVYPVGGLREKLVTGHLHEIQVCIIPAQNRKDLTWLPPSVRHTLQILAVTDFDEVKELL